MNHGRKNVARGVLALSFILALVLLAPIAANAQVTVKHIKVIVGPAPGSSGVTATYCDTGTSGCDQQLWNLGANGITLAGGQNLILTQTAAIPVAPGVNGGNFDTSDRVRPVPASPTTAECGTTGGATPCAVTIQLDTGSGLTTVINGLNTELNNFNTDIPNQVTHQEQRPWSAQPYVDAINYTLRLGYADNVHGCTTNCFPNPWNGSPNTTFIGAGQTFPGFPCAPGTCFDAGAILITGVTVISGRMTGGGSIFKGDLRITHGFELHCNASDTPNNLEINWDGGNNFHLTTLLTARCIDNPAIAPPPPNADFDTFIGTGVGTCNGLPAAISFILTDAGEPGSKDTATYAISGGCTLMAPTANLDKGNHQAHKQN